MMGVVSSVTELLRMGEGVDVDVAFASVAAEGGRCVTVASELQQRLAGLPDARPSLLQEEEDV